jgi:hypothetical protein
MGTAAAGDGPKLMASNTVKIRIGAGCAIKHAVRKLN